MSHVTRRRLLAGAGAVTGSALLMSCGSGDDDPGSGAPQAGAVAEPPTHIPFEAVSPDLPGTADGVTAGFFNYPSPPVERSGFPLPETEPITALFQGSAAISPDDNPVYQQFREEVGNQIEGTTILSTEYNAKFQTTIAGNSLPDLVQIMSVPRLPELLESRFTDLTEVLAGDNIGKYPALASFTAENWAVSSLNGRIWGIPQPRPPAGRVMMTRGDLLAEKGIPADPDLSDGEDFVALLAELTDPDAGVYAIGGDPAGWLLHAVREMCGAPNVWAAENGTFVHEIEAEETVEALNQAAKIIQAGYAHPEAFLKPAENHPWFMAGVTPLLIQGFTGWSKYSRTNPEYQVGHVRLPRWSGGGLTPIYASAAGYGAYIGISKQDDPDRVDELLRVMDYIASPFGTTQYLNITYGVEGVTYTMEDGEPTFIKDKSAEILQGWPYAGGGAQNVLYVPGDREAVQRQYDYLSQMLPEARRDASTGLYSETAMSSGATWRQRRQDTERGILLGEMPISEWTSFVEDWKADVGNQMAEEFAEAASS